MTDYNPTEAQRLSISADDKAALDWARRHLRANWAVTEAHRAASAIDKILADQFEAAAREAERIPDLKAAIGYEIEKRDALEAERDSLHQQLEAAQRSHADDLEMFRATESDLAHNHRRADAAEADLAVAQQRIAELMEALDDAIQRDDDAAALRAIYPVYRAAVEWRRMVMKFEEHSKRRVTDPWAQPAYSLADAVDTARAAITSEILAAMKRAGLEIE